jgi:hypothetical protein
MTAWLDWQRQAQSLLIRIHIRPQRLTRSETISKQAETNETIRSSDSGQSALLPEEECIGRSSNGRGGLFGADKVAFGQSSSGRLNKGDVAILRFLAAARLIESDLWIRDAKLGGIGDNPPIEIDPNEQLNNYQIALLNLDGDGPQSISSNTIDEIRHAASSMDTWNPKAQTRSISTSSARSKAARRRARRTLAA